MSNMPSGKVALVTGGSRGIGAAIVRRLAKDGASAGFTYAGNQAKAGEVVAARRLPVWWSIRPVRNRRL